ncbi:MAG TPA: hemerythrin domain-containing protein [Stellaceae bacterium]|nr:hemerythrin domain-containing protein [Stellaceae bacterium]
MATKHRPDAIALLKADHRKVEGLFKQFEASKSDSKKQALAKEICIELMVHATIEEEIFYPACKNKIEDNTLDEAYVEHDGAKILISEIADSAPDNEFFDSKVHVLSELIKHHVGEEEARVEGMFAQAKAAGLDVEALGNRLAVRKAELLAQFKANGLPAPTTRSFTGHKLKQGSPISARSAAGDHAEAAE